MTTAPTTAAPEPSPIPRFYPVLPDAAWIERLVPLGVSIVQLRFKSHDGPAIRDQISHAMAICRDNDCQLIVNDHWQEAIELGADFVHLGQEDLTSADLPAIRSAGLRYGISSHDTAELERAISVAPTYIALGPIFETTLKKMPWAPQGLARVQQWKFRIHCPLVAIGGLTVERAPSVFEAGADSLAVVTDLITAADPEQRTVAWLRWADTASRSAVSGSDTAPQPQ